MTDHDLRATLGNNALFSSLDESVRDDLAERSRRIALRAGEILFHAGDAAEQFFVVESGLIKLSRSNPDGQEKVIHLVRPRESFAEAVMFMDAKRFPVTAEALETSRLVGIPSDDYRNVLKDSPDTCMRLLADLSMRLRSRLDDIDQLTLQQSRPRVVRYLMAQASGQVHAGDEVHLPAPKHVVASRLSMTPETLSRILHELGASGLIRVERRRVTLVDPEGLRALT